MPTTATTGTELRAARPLGLAVVTYNSAQPLARFGPSHIALAKLIGAPLVIFDNASEDETTDVARGLGEDGGPLQLIESDRNLGYAAGVNRAVATFPNRDILLLNPDVEAPTPAQLNVLRERLRGPKVAAVSPGLVGDDGLPQPVARRFPSVLALLGSSGRARRFPPIAEARRLYEELSWGDEAMPVDWVIGAAVVLKREVFELLGGWDESYFLYMEDVDFCRRCASQGYEVWYEPSVSLKHEYARSSTAGSDAAAARARRAHVASTARLFARYPSLAIGRGRRA